MGTITAFFCPDLQFVVNTDDLLNNAYTTIPIAELIPGLVDDRSGQIFVEESKFYRQQAFLSMEEDFKDSIIVTRLETIDGGSYSKVYRIFIDGTEIKAEEVLYVATTDLKIENLLLYDNFMLYRSEE